MSEAFYKSLISFEKFVDKTSRPKQECLVDAWKGHTVRDNRRLVKSRGELDMNRFPLTGPMFMLCVSYSMNASSVAGVREDRISDRVCCGENDASLINKWRCRINKH